jgi:hypothetical protein
MYNPTRNMPAFVLKVGPTVLGAYTVKTSTGSFDWSMVQDETFSNIRSVAFLGIDYGKSPRLCREKPGSTLCATGQGEYLAMYPKYGTGDGGTPNNPPSDNHVYPYDRGVATAGVSPGKKFGTETPEPFGRYDWYLRYGNAAPIKLGGYTTAPDYSELDYKFGCISDYGLVKNGINDAYASVTVYPTEACNSAFRSKYYGIVTV